MTRMHATLKALSFSIAIISTLLLAGCASTSKQDPFENFNRGIHSFNMTADKWVMKPIAKSYDYILPDFVQTGVGNFFGNLTYPVVIVNQFLQGKFKRGFQDIGRFALNSTLGIAGLFDVGTEAGLMEHNEDFGQTLSVWGLGTGPYIVVPILGPHTLGSGVGAVADLYANPITYIESVSPRNKLIILSAIDKRAKLLEAEKLITGDKYLFIRDAYLQKRSFLINDGEMEEEDPFLDDDE